MAVGFIGLGRMGSAMARNIAKAGHRVRAWNRSPVTGELDIVPIPTDALRSDVTFTMLSDDAAITEVLLASSALSDARSGLVHVGPSTISVEFSGLLRARHAELGIGYVAAPVFGRPEAAEQAQLEVLAAGERTALDKAGPLLDLLGRRTWVLDDDPPQANAAKIAGNILITMAIEAMAEAVVLTGTAGLAPERFFELILETLFGSRVYEMYSAKILSGDFEPGFRMDLRLKDLHPAVVATEKADPNLPLLHAMHDRMAEAINAGMRDKDWSAVAEYTRRRVGAGSTGDVR